MKMLADEDVTMTLTCFIHYSYADDYDCVVMLLLLIMMMQLKVVAVITMMMTTTTEETAKTMLTIAAKIMTMTIKIKKITMIADTDY